MRKCIEEKNDKGIPINIRCPHYFFRKKACELLGKGLTPSIKMPQRYCPIQRGYGVGVTFNENLLKFNKK